MLCLMLPFPHKSLMLIIFFNVHCHHLETMLCYQFHILLLQLTYALHFTDHVLYNKSLPNTQLLSSLLIFNYLSPSSLTFTYLSHSRSSPTFYTFITFHLCFAYICREPIQCSGRWGRSFRYVYCTTVKNVDMCNGFLICPSGGALFSSTAL